MEIWVIWLVAALVIFILEIFTAGFALMCFSIGAAASSVCALFTNSLNWQISVFVIVSAFVFAFIRPIVLKTMKDKSGSKGTNVDALRGRVVTVSENFVKGEGRVKIDGDDWKAVSDDTCDFEVGEKLVVTEINSAILTVKKQ